jgi:hypothetical protein
MPRSEKHKINPEAPPAFLGKKKKVGDRSNSAFQPSDRASSPLARVVREDRVGGAEWLC